MSSYRNKTMLLNATRDWKNNYVITICNKTKKKCANKTS